MGSARHGVLEETLLVRSVDSRAVVGCWTGSRKSEAEASSLSLWPVL